MLNKLLPDKMLITGSNPLQYENFLTRFKIALESGIKLVQLRTHGLGMLTYLELVIVVQNLCVMYEAQLVLNFPITSPLPILSDVGLHLASWHLMTLTSRPIGYELIGASCHTANELIQAAKLGLNYAVLSPVLITISHPQVQPLGWNKFAELVAQVPIPVYALGGMTIADISIAKRYGAHGIAGISGLWPIVDRI